jgi:hypothetical protein
MWFKGSFLPSKHLLNPDPNGVTVILTVWKRNHLAEQLEALYNQTELPYQIWVFQNDTHIDIKKVLRNFPAVEIIGSTFNLKYFARFALGQFVKSRYTWIFDDDVIPSANWLKKSRKKCEQENAIIASAGRIIPEGDYMPERMQNVGHYFFGDVNANVPYNFCAEDTVVDFGNNSWFFKAEWIKAMWQIPLLTLETGEDIHFSAACKLKLGVSTIVPEQIDEQTCGNLKKMYGYDAFASWTKPGFLESRAKIIRYLIEQHGWNPIRWNEQITISQ